MARAAEEFADAIPAAAGDYARLRGQRARLFRLDDERLDPRDLMSELDNPVGAPGDGGVASMGRG